MVRYTDETSMPFGKYKGQKLANIPAAYFLFLEDQEWVKGALREYITNNKAALLAENKRNQQMMKR